eukprot:5156778-Pyramimonas_sp.AAC.2
MCGARGSRSFRVGAPATDRVRLGRRSHSRADMCGARGSRSLRVGAPADDRVRVGLPFNAR